MKKDIKSFFSEEQKVQIVDAVKVAEKETSGEIRVHIENRCKRDVLDKAAFVFEKLEMHKTELRNGVLFYLAVKDQKFAILGDAGINSSVPDNFWDETKEAMFEEFKQNQFAEGLVKGIQMAGEKLKEFFPYQSDDVNELSDDISFEEN
ncbi:MAG: TPM domain-containing protein [Bacteroidetes bacterium]|nr:MAG: TPM domain-containing protein [Bacteroidota bacterium]